MTSIETPRLLNRRTISRDLTLSLALMTALVVSIFGAAYQIYYANQQTQDLKIEAAALISEFTEVLVRRCSGIWTWTPSPRLPRPTSVLIF